VADNHERPCSSGRWKEQEQVTWGGRNAGPLSWPSAKSRRIPCNESHLALVAMQPASHFPASAQSRRVSVCVYVSNVCTEYARTAAASNRCTAVLCKCVRLCLCHSVRR
jgi:hypothetical protein